MDKIEITEEMKHFGYIVLRNYLNHSPEWEYISEEMIEEYAHRYVNETVTELESEE